MIAAADGASSLPLAPFVAGAVAFGVAVFLGRRMLAAGVGSVQAATAGRGADGGLETAAWIPRSARASMEAAGLFGADAQVSFILVRAFALAVGGIVGAVGAARVESGPVAALVAAAGLVVGWWMPVAWLEARRERRRAEIAADFPVMLDLLEIGLEGGLGLPAAWSNVSGTLRGTCDALADEMRRIEVEVAFGLDWSVALERAADRSHVAAFRSLASLIGQSTRFGTELSRVIVVLSDSLRLEAMQALEERAHVASVRLLVPLGAVLLPATLVVLVGPLLLMLIETLQGVNAD